MNKIYLYNNEHIKVIKSYNKKLKFYTYCKSHTFCLLSSLVGFFHEMASVGKMKIGDFVTFEEYAGSQYNEEYYNKRVGKIVEIFWNQQRLEVVTADGKRQTTSRVLNLVPAAVPMYAVGETISATIGTGLWEREIVWEIVAVTVFGDCVEYKLRNGECILQSSLVRSHKVQKSSHQQEEKELIINISDLSMQLAKLTTQLAKLHAQKSNPRKGEQEAVCNVTEMSVQLAKLTTQLREARQN